MLLYEADAYAAAYTKVMRLRKEGKLVAMQLWDEEKTKEEYVRFAKLNFTDCLMFPDGEVVTVS